GDRFIPVRSAMDFDVANLLLTTQEIKKDRSSWSEYYQKLLSECFLNNRTRIFVFKSKPPAPVNEMFQEYLGSSCKSRVVKQWRHIPKNAERTLDAPNMIGDYCLSLLDWGSSNVLAVALGSTVYLLNASNRYCSELVSVGDDGPITSVSWSPDGQ
uniref:Cell division cycle 20.2, cofactor of APC complex-like n=1 Tax=Elaeis guineensis var. tenera TaxID=51953 RepID=A0A6I9QNM8_ELAGV